MFRMWKYGSRRGFADGYDELEGYLGFNRLMCLPLNKCLEWAVVKSALLVVFIAETYN